MIEEIEGNLPQTTTTTTPSSIKLPQIHPGELLGDVQDEGTCLQEEWRKRREEIAELIAKINANDKKAKALTQLIAVHGPAEVEQQPPQMHTGQAPISNKVKVLVINKVVHGKMMQVEAACTYKILASLVECIIQVAQHEEDQE
jgi:hypothetical protein